MNKEDNNRCCHKTNRDKLSENICICDLRIGIEAIADNNALDIYAWNFDLKAVIQGRVIDGNENCAETFCICKILLTANEVLEDLGSYDFLWNTFGSFQRIISAICVHRDVQKMFSIILEVLCV